LEITFQIGFHFVFFNLGQATQTKAVYIFREIPMGGASAIGECTGGWYFPIESVF
jgi:hypothetical protein